jgi:hypothetical protein
MPKRPFKIFSIAFCVAWMFLSGAAGATGRPTLMKQLTETITKVQTGDSLTARTDAAEHLADLTKKVHPDKVDDKTLASMVSLLDSPEDSVRAWVAGAIGFLGPRAISAAPVLLKLLPEADCVQGDLTSAGAIRLALKKIGAKAPPQSTCGTAAK